MSSEWIYSCGKEVARAGKAHDAFQEKFRVLPVVHPDGSSECPFARDLYRDSYEAEDLMRQSAEELARLLDANPEAIHQCREPLDEIDADDEDAEAKRAKAQEDLDRHQEMASALAKMLRQLRTALNQAKGRRYPGMSP